MSQQITMNYPIKELESIPGTGNPVYAANALHTLNETILFQINPVNKSWQQAYIKENVTPNT